MRIQAESGAINTATSLQQCQDCNFGFYCSKSHWDLARHSHQEEPCSTGLNGLSRCATNNSVYENLKFIHARNKSRLGDYCWAPKRTKPQWTSLKSVDWNDFKDEFWQDHAGEVDHPREVKFRAATEGLAMPMTILWALENLNSDDSWTKKETLNIHVRFPNLIVTGLRIERRRIHRLLEHLRRNSIMPMPLKKFYTGFRKLRR